MPRTRAPHRLDQIVDAALHTFTAVGYRRARMSDVAAAAGVSPGLLYSYATGKEALFALVVQRESGVDIDALDLPIECPAPKQLTALLRQGFATLADVPALTLAEKVDRPVDITAEVAAVVGEHFDGVSEHCTLLRLVERCAIDWPELATSHYEKGRRPHVDRLARYLTRRRDAGYLAPIDDVDIAARFVIETVAWFANHRFGDHDGAQFDSPSVRAEVVMLITRSLTGR